VAYVSDAVAGVLGSTQKVSTSGTTPTQSLGRDDFFALLIAELKNQDPMEPKDDTEFLSQLAQFSSLEEMRALTETQSTLLSYQIVAQAAALLGRTVEAQVVDSSTGKTTTVTGTVSEVSLSTSPPSLMVDGQKVDISSVTRVY